MSGMSLHKKLEENAGLLIFGILFVASIGGLVQVLPTVLQDVVQDASTNARVYCAVDLTGRDIYIREGCSVCHSQQVRPLIAEVERYGPYSHAGEFVYDRPFLLGVQAHRP
jgi:cytochrome c oxidase cbb3-type subunit 2